MPMMTSSSYVTIDIEDLEISLRKIDENISSISRIKRRVSGIEVYENAYDPVVVSIGPYHHQKDNLQDMREMKLNCMDYILKLNKKKTLQDYIKELRKVEHIARRYYTEKIEMESKELLNMLLLDGIFILTSLYAIDWSYNHEDFCDVPPAINPNKQMEPLQYCFVTHDLLLMENQIPFFVMKMIHNLFTGEENPIPSLAEKIAHFVEQILRHYPKSIKETSRPRDFHHLLHLCHIYLKPSQNYVPYFMQFLDGQIPNYWRSATQYHIAGVQFKKREFDENNPHSLLDVRFIDDVLEIPHLPIDENTPSLFVNLVSLEQTNLKFGNDISSYILFLSQLINSAKDVALLVNKGIIEHDLRCEDEVVDLFLRLSKDVVFDFTSNFYLKNICHNLEACYVSRMKWWNVCFRVFRRSTSVISGG